MIETTCKSISRNTVHTVIISAILVTVAPLSAQIYVAATGDDANPGTLSQPYRTIAKAVSSVASGDTIYVRGGTYDLTVTISIGSSKSGAANQMITLTGYRDERPLLNFSNQAFGSRAVKLNADYWHIRGFDIKGAGDNGLQISGGSYNIVERCSFFENRDTGLQLSNGASNNRILNCDSYHNADPPDYGDADGFAPKLDVGTGNYFFGCRAWGNCDDGWDGYMRGATDVTTTMEYCWTWGNGYLKDGTDPGPKANGNGFKMGGGDDGNSQELMHHVTLVHCLAFGNKNKGFDQNNNVGSMTLYHCTGYDNRTANYRIQRELVSGQSLVVKNSASYDGSVELGGFAVQEANSWMPPYQMTADDFLSLDPSSMDAPRKPDGSLPNIDFLNLAEGSDLIDAGVDIGLPFNGPAPDIGAFESEDISPVGPETVVARDFVLWQNFPNPFNASTIIRYRIPKPGYVTLKIFDLKGREISGLVDEYRQAGTYDTPWHADNLPSGIYLYRLQTGASTDTKKLILKK